MTSDEADKAAPAPQPEPKAPFDGTSETLIVPHSDAAAPTPSQAAPAKPAATSPPAPKPEVWIGKSLGKYQVTSVLGVGGMGVVLKARDPLLERDVALKVLADNLATDSAAVGRFLSEAKAAGKINHPNVVAIYEICQQGTLAYLVLEYVSGGSIEERLTPRKPLPIPEATQIIIDACRGVGAAHVVGLIHRDIKPGNFMRAADGSVKVSDFGLAKPTGTGREFTQAGTVVGTPFYMSPEQCEAKPLDARSDIYALGATYYTLLTAKRPFHNSETIPQLMYAHCHTPAPDPRTLNPLVPPACAAIVSKAMAKAPADRYQSTAAMLADLQAVVATLSDGAIPTTANTALISAPTDVKPVASPEPPSKPSRRALLLAAGGVLATGGVAAWLAFGRKKSHDGAPELTATAPGVTATDITVGMTAPFSGSAKELGRGMQIGIETYFKHLNETANGVHGRKLKLLVRDDEYEPTKCLAAVKEMIHEKPVFAFVGSVGTPTAQAVLPTVLENKRIFFGAFTGAPILRKDPPDRYVFNYRASYAEEAAATVQYLLSIRRVKPDEIAVFAQNDGFGNAGFDGVARALRKVGFDPRNIVRVGYERNSLDIDAAVTGLLAHKDRIKAVLMVPTYKPAALFVKRIIDGGMNPIFTSVSFVNSNALADSLREMGPKYCNGVIITQVVPFFGSGATGVLEYRERLSSYSSAEQPGFVSLEGYIVARIFCAGLEKAGPELTTEKLVDALEGIRDLDFGIGTKISFGPSDHQASSRVWAATLDAAGHFHNLDLD